MRLLRIHPPTSFAFLAAGVLLVVACFLSSFRAQAASDADIRALEDSRSRIFAILTAVAQTDGYIDGTIHREFWSLLPRNIRDKIRDNPRAFLNQLDIVKAMSFQKELWESIRLSARAKRVVKTISYDAAVPADIPNARDVVGRADQMLKAAATGKPYQGRSGPMLLNEDAANRVLDGLSASYGRLNRLLDSTWRDQ